MLKAEQGGNNLRQAADAERMADQPFDRGQRYFMLKDIPGDYILDSVISVVTQGLAVKIVRSSVAQHIIYRPLHIPSGFVLAIHRFSVIIRRHGVYIAINSCIAAKRMFLGFQNQAGSPSDSMKPLLFC